MVTGVILVAISVLTGEARVAIVIIIPVIYGAGVLMLDAGLELESDRAQIVRQCAGTQPTAWNPGHLAKLKEGMAGDAKGVPLKRVFGSDFPYRETEEKIPWRNHGTGLKPSLALGGLSNTWGCLLYTSPSPRD